MGQYGKAGTLESLDVYEKKLYVVIYKYIYIRYTF